MARIAPSVLGADFGNLEQEIRSADAAGVDMFHLDIMDGHFVPNISYGPGIVKTINNITDTYLDVHLMLSEPERYFEPFAEAGGDSITFHIEVHPEPSAYARQIKSMGCDAGISLNPDMPMEKVLPYLGEFDYLLIMSVFPGFGGQSFIEASLAKVKVARDFIDSHGLSTKVMVDGGVDTTNADRVVEAGADILVMGTAFFNAKDRRALTEQVRGLSKAR